MQGKNILIQSNKDYKVLKYNNEIVGCGKSTGEKIIWSDFSYTVNLRTDAFKNKKIFLTVFKV